MRRSHIILVVTIMASAHVAFSLVPQLDTPFPTREVARSAERAFWELDQLARFHNDHYFQAYVRCQAALKHYWGLQIKRSQILDVRSSRTDGKQLKRDLMNKALQLSHEAQILPEKSEEFRGTVAALP